MPMAYRGMSIDGTTQNPESLAGGKRKPGLFCTSAMPSGSCRSNYNFWSGDHDAISISFASLPEESPNVACQYTSCSPVSGCSGTIKRQRVTFGNGSINDNIAAQRHTAATRNYERRAESLQQCTLARMQSGPQQQPCRQTYRPAGIASTGSKDFSWLPAQLPSGFTEGRSADESCRPGPMDLNHSSPPSLAKCSDSNTLVSSADTQARQAAMKTRRGHLHNEYVRHVDSAEIVSARAEIWNNASLRLEESTLDPSRGTDVPATAQARQLCSGIAEVRRTKELVLQLQRAPREEVVGFSSASVMRQSLPRHSHRGVVPMSLGYKLRQNGYKLRQNSPLPIHVCSQQHSQHEAPALSHETKMPRTAAAPVLQGAHQLGHSCSPLECPSTLTTGERYHYEHSAREQTANSAQRCNVTAPAHQSGAPLIAITACSIQPQTVKESVATSSLLHHSKFASANHEACRYSSSSKPHLLEHSLINQYLPAFAQLPQHLPHLNVQRYAACKRQPRQQCPIQSARYPGVAAKLDCIARHLPSVSTHLKAWHINMHQDSRPPGHLGQVSQVHHRAVSSLLHNSCSSPGVLRTTSAASISTADLQCPLHSKTPSENAAELLTRWDSFLGLSFPETPLLTLYVWDKLQCKIQMGLVHSSSNTVSPWLVDLLGCLWVAMKLEECRRELPTASQMGALLGISARAVAAAELHVMMSLDWAPTAGWQTMRRALNA